MTLRITEPEVSGASNMALVDSSVTALDAPSRSLVHRKLREHYRQPTRVLVSDVDVRWSVISEWATRQPLKAGEAA